MRLFAELYRRLDRSVSLLRKVDALAWYFQAAPPRDAAWALYALLGRRRPRPITTTNMRIAAAELAQMPDWLFDECYASVGDLSETIALLVADAKNETISETPLHEWLEQRFESLRGLTPGEQQAKVSGWWRGLSAEEIFLANKLLSGNFRTGAARQLVIRGLAKALSVDESRLTEALMGEWEPTEEFFLGLRHVATSERATGTPYPFFLASPIEGAPAQLGPVADYLLEWKWDGIRCQIIHRQNKVYLWSRGEDLVTDRFPEIEKAARTLPEGTVLDGEIVVWTEEGIQPFAALQTRIGRKKLSAKILESTPVRAIIFDCLESEGRDLREEPLAERRRRAIELLQKGPLELSISEPILAETWADAERQRATSRERGVEGLVVKRWTSPYRAGRKRGDWWKWKIEPFTMDAVLIYAQPGSGRRATLYTDYTFGVWKGEELVPVAKAYSGLTDEEIAELDRWIRSHTLERFGPVRSVKAERVYELAFEGLAVSKRHKAGIAVRFPRILRARVDKKPQEADTVERLMELTRVDSSQD